MGPDWADESVWSWGVAAGSVGVGRLRDALRRYGLADTMSKALRLAVGAPARRARARRSRAFDERYGVDTAEIVRVGDLGVASPNLELAVRYQPSGVDGFRDVLAALPIDYEDYVFVDIGSGKGRVLLLASEHPFRRIVGVEFSRDLNEIAARNLERFSSERQRCREFELVTTDAVEYEYPVEPLVLYLYNPFQPSVLRPVLARLRASLEEHPRRVLVVLTGAPSLEEVVTQAGLTRLDLPGVGPTSAVFVTDGPPAA